MLLFFLFKLAAKFKEITSLEDTVAALKEDYERSLSANTASQKDLQENLISAKHELLRVQEQLALAEKVHHCGLYLQLTTTHSRIELNLNQKLIQQLQGFLMFPGHCVNWTTPTPILYGFES